MIKNLYVILFSTSLLFSSAVIKHKTAQKKYIDKSKIKLTLKTKSSKVKKIVNRTYVVKQGDTIFDIARKFKVSIGDIYKVNKLKPNRLIYPGNKLKIPTITYVKKAQEAVKKNKKTVYKIKKGDTLISIAKKFNMKVDDIIKLNKHLSRKKVNKSWTRDQCLCYKKDIKKEEKSY